MEAAQAYWHAAHTGKLPNIFLVESANSRAEGLAVSVINVSLYPEVLEAATHPDPWVRARTALTGLTAARESIEEAGSVRAL